MKLIKKSKKIYRRKMFMHKKSKNVEEPISDDTTNDEVDALKNINEGMKLKVVIINMRNKLLKISKIQKKLKM